MGTALHRFTLTFPKEIDAAVEEYQQAFKIKTKSKAIQELIKNGIADVILDEQRTVYMSELQKELFTLTENMHDDGIRVLISVAREINGSNRKNKAKAK